MILTGLMIRGVVASLAVDNPLLDETFSCMELEEGLVAQYTSPLRHTYAMNSHDLMLAYMH